jgi:hypothetical protein
MTRVEDRAKTAALKELLERDEDFVRSAVQSLVQAALEAEMTEALAAEKGERTDGRLGYRSGYYSRALITRVGTLELRVPQDRSGRFSTELFERYGRSEKALVGTLAEMYVQGVSHGKSRRSPRRYAGTASRRPRSARSTRVWMRACGRLPSGVWRTPIPISFSTPVMSGCVRGVSLSARRCLSQLRWTGKAGGKFWLWSWPIARAGRAGATFCSACASGA